MQGLESHGHGMPHAQVLCTPGLQYAPSTYLLLLLTDPPGIQGSQHVRQASSVPPQPSSGPGSGTAQEQVQPQTLGLCGFFCSSPALHALPDAPLTAHLRDDRKCLGTDKEKTVLLPQTKFYNDLGQVLECCL